MLAWIFKLLLAVSFYHVQGADVYESTTCHNYYNHNTVITYKLTSTDDRLNAYYLPYDFTSVDILTTEPLQADYNNHYVSWHTHSISHTLVVVGTVANTCINDAFNIESRGRKWYPFVYGGE